MGVVEDFLNFTTETGEEFSDGWLPTLDMALKVSPENKILFKFWEKPTNTNRTINKRSSMGENMKQQILTQEIIRRLGNTCEDLGREDYKEIIDGACQKMANSGYGGEQMRRIVIAGIRGWGNKILRCKAEGRRLRRTAKESQGARTRMKLLGKSTWFRGDKGVVLRPRKWGILALRGRGGNMSI